MIRAKHLEARFYAYAAGRSSAEVEASADPAVRGRAVAFSDPVLAGYAREIAADKAEHLVILARLAPDAPPPRTDLSVHARSPFSAIAQAAGLVPADAPFDPYASDRDFLLASLMLEGVGAGVHRQARAGAPDLTALTPIVADAAYHAALIDTALRARAVADPSLADAASRITAVLAAGGGSDEAFFLDRASSEAVPA
jgi:Ferritin-like domain